MSRLASEEIVRVLERLPTGVVVFDAALVVTYANVTARRLLHPEPLRVGLRLANVNSRPPLTALADQVMHRHVVSPEDVELGDRVLAVRGTFDRGTASGTFVIEDVTVRARRFRSEEDFVVNASHEILGPVAAIAGAAQVLQGGAKDDPLARDRFIAHIAAAADRLTSTATALLVLAKAEAGLGGPPLELVPVKPVVEEVGRGKDDVTVDCERSLAVLADADLFRQAVTILVENARRHSHDGVGIRVADEGRLIAVDIVDSGGGILPENLERVTERFFTGAGRDSGGYGIGLSIAARAADVLGGTLEFASNRSGTRARLQLPSARLL